MGLNKIDRAVVASAIQLARKRRARRALLVHRDGPIRKESSLSTQPVLEVGPRSDGVDGEGKGGSGGGEPIVPIVQASLWAVHAMCFCVRSFHLRLTSRRR